LISTKIKSEVKDLRTSNILKIYQACLRLKYTDHKLFVQLNSQVKKRLKYLYGKNIISCCASNIACKYEEAEKFTKTMLTHFIDNNLINKLVQKDLVNLLVLMHEVSKFNLDFSENIFLFRTNCKMLVDQAVKIFLDRQRKYLQTAKNSPRSQEDVENVEISLRNQLIPVYYTNKFLRSLIFLKYYDKNVISMIQTLLNGNFAVSMEDLLYMITYALKYKEASKNSEFSIDSIIQKAFPKLEESLSKVKF